MNAQFGRSRVVILAFHKIGEPPPSALGNPYYIPEAGFKRHLSHLRDEEWKVISADTFLGALSAPQSLPPRAVLIAFDDGCKSLLSCAFPSLCEFGYPSVVFIPTDFVGGYNDFDEGRHPKEAICSWDDLRELERLGCSIQSHGVRHRSLRQLSPEEQEEELNSSKRTIEDELGKQVEMFAYPFGEVPEGEGFNQLLGRVDQAGYRAAFQGGGGVVADLNRDNPRYLPRVGMYPDSNLVTMLKS